MAFADNEFQAEMMSQLLQREGIACTYQDLPGVQNVGGLRVWVTGPWPTSRREIIVNAADAARATQVLRTDGQPHHEHPRKPARQRLRSKRTRDP